MATQEQHDKLVAIAESVGNDIKGDHDEADVAYDMYIEELDGVLVGVIDMGDSWSAVFEWQQLEANKEVCGWWQVDADSYTTTEKILRKRGAL